MRRRWAGGVRRSVSEICFDAAARLTERWSDSAEDNGGSARCADFVVMGRWQGARQRQPTDDRESRRKKRQLRLRNRVSARHEVTRRPYTTIRLESGETMKLPIGGQRDFLDQAALKCCHHWRRDRRGRRGRDARMQKTELGWLRSNNVRTTRLSFKASTIFKPFRSTVTGSSPCCRLRFVRS